MLSAFAAHLRAQRGLSEHTVRGYRGDVVSLLATLAPTGSDPEATDLAGLDLLALRSWLAALSARGHARASIARRAAASRTFTAWAVRNGWLAVDPGPRLLAPRADQVVPHILTEEEAVTLLRTAGELAQDGEPVAVRDWAALELLYASGLRISELVGLDITHVDFFVTAWCGCWARAPRNAWCPSGCRHRGR
ncbi:site-specific integrase [Sanguibacter sp. Z1732]|uniref:site-specific integrase n=1 Tax=Sanguibacter sp. Z1732 TaxID=3435412 RepID=UPI003D9C9210